MVEFTEDEAALYDRQIRLWGVDAQRALRSANVYIKRCGPLGAEICKNIVLSGVNSLTLCDPRLVEEKDAATNFLLRAQAGKSFADTAVPNLQILNPLVRVTSTEEELSEENIGQYSVVCITDGLHEEYGAVNELCRAHGVTFLACNTWGMAGFLFQDAGAKFTYIAEKARVHKEKSTGKPDPKRRKVDTPGGGKENAEEEEEEEDSYEEREANFVTYREAGEATKLKFSSPSVLITQGLLRGVPDLRQYCRETAERIHAKHVPDDLLQNLDGTIVPICAIVGGMASQEVIKVVSKKDPPIVNSFYYDGLSGAGIIENTRQ